MEKVSIITPCFNTELYLTETYECLKKQTYSEWEWIVFDDCSTDNSFTILTDICQKDSRVKVYKNEFNSGAAITRNNCLNKATGAYLAFLDCDDVWVPEKLDKQVTFINQKKADFIFSNYEMIDAKGEFIKKMQAPDIVTASDLLKYNPFATSSVFIRRSAVENYNIRFLEHLRRRQDYIFWYDVIKVNSSAVGMKEFLSKYRQVGSSSLSSNKKKMAVIQWRMYRDEFKLDLMPSLYYLFHYAINGIKKYFFK
jgi:teichuronic acid biosynthesis glycosyltransferase TuaG